MYKKSMFNYEYYDGTGKVRLYNSYMGFDSLTIIDEKDYEEICLHLNNEDIENHPKFNILKKRGYFVESKTDEKLLRELKYMDILEESILRLIILPTEKCNFKCLYCYEEFKNGKMSLDTQNNLVRYVQKNIMKFSSMEVRWFGGEPLEALDVIESLSKEFIRICKNAKRPYSASMTTNGYNLSLENFKKLYKLHVYNYQITVDGIQKTHDRQRVLVNGIGTFERIIKNLVCIKENIHSGIPRFTIRTNFTKYTAQYIDEYLEYFSRLFAEDNRFSFSIQKASDWGGERVKEMCDNLIEDDFYAKILDYISKKQNKLDFSTHGALMNGSTCVCYANKRNSFVIGSNGYIYKCTGDFRFCENHIGQLKNGEMDIDDNLHAQWLCTRNRNFERCDDCFFSGACMMSSCPSSFLKKQKSQEGICLLEERFIKQFLQLFSLSNYTII